MKNSTLCSILLLVFLNLSCVSKHPVQKVGLRDINSEKRILRIATNSEISALDPHYQYLDTNLNVAFQIFEALTSFGPNKELLPQLAEKWELQRDSRVWKFYLKKDVLFHDGSPFDKFDVLATLDRVMDYSSDRSSGFISNVNKIDLNHSTRLNHEEKDPFILYIATKEYSRFLPFDIASILIMNRKDAEAAKELGRAQKTENVLVEFSRGRWLNGTGPFRFESWIRLDGKQNLNGKARVELRRHQSAPRVGFDQVHYIPLPEATDRLEALKQKWVDIAVALPGDTLEVKTLKTPGLRVIHLQLFQGHDDRETRQPLSPALNLHQPVRDSAGKKLQNPLSSLNFRKALALSVNKHELVEIAEGQGQPNEQYLSSGQIGFIKNMPESRFNIEKARKHLLEASKEIGFEFLADQELLIKIHGPEGRYFKDKEVLHAVAKMWTDAFRFQFENKKYSIRFEAKTEPMSTYTVNGKWYLVNLVGGGVDNGQGEAVLRLYLTPNSSLNYSSYSNSQINKLYSEGSKATNPEQGDQMFLKALKIAFLKEQAMIPLYNTLETWGVNPGICFRPRKDGLTLAKDVEMTSPCPY